MSTREAARENPCIIIKKHRLFFARGKNLRVRGGLVIFTCPTSEIILDLGLRPRVALFVPVLKTSNAGNLPLFALKMAMASVKRHLLYSNIVLCIISKRPGKRATSEKSSLWRRGPAHSRRSGCGGAKSASASLREGMKACKAMGRWWYWPEVPRGGLRSGNCRAFTWLADVHRQPAISAGSRINRH